MSSGPCLEQSSSSSYFANTVPEQSTAQAIDLRQEDFSKALRTAIEIASITTAATTGNLVTASTASQDLFVNSVSKTPQENVEIVTENHARNTGAGISGAPELAA